MVKQCPKCGILSSDAEFIGSFCSECYIEMNIPELPVRITVYECRECGAKKIKSWNEGDWESAIAHLLRSKRFGVPEIRIGDEKIYARFAGINRQFSIPLRVKRSLCDSCMKKFSGYYEAIIQLRGNYANDNKFAHKLMRSIEKATFISKIIELKEGIDIYCGSKAIVRSILSAMKLKPKVSHTLYGIKKGRKVYRTTFLIK